MNRLEHSILKNLIYNETFARKVLPFLRTDYFSDNTEKVVYKEVDDFINKYNSLPTHEALIINFSESKKLTEQEVRNSIELIQNINQHKEEPTEM
jgi:hypothetical protein